MAKNTSSVLLAKEASSGQGKSYGYQQPKEVETTTGSDVDTQKQKVVSAFDDFLDALADRVPGAGGTAGSTGTGIAPSEASSGVPTSGGAGGDKGAPPSGGTGGGKGAVSSGEKASESAQREALERTIVIQKEAYKVDRMRESAKLARRESEAKPAPAPAVNAAGLLSKHQSDSNRAPLTESKEFMPSFGNQGRPQGSITREKMAVPLSKRPETVPALGAVNIGKPIDAYFGSFGTAIERAIARGKLDVKRYEVILGEDDRVQVTNNQVYPWRCICSLLITANTGATYVGTGWLVAPRLMLTAGHCVYMLDEGGWVRSIEVIPGRNADERPFGSAVATDFRSVTGWTQDNDSNFDYGAILLPEANRYGDQLGWFGYASRTDDYLKNLTLNLSGYPGDGGKTGVDGTQWFHSRTIKDVMERQISYEIDTYGGQSGSPVWEMQSDGSRYGVAIHTWGTSVSNGGTRITGDVFDNIVRWAGEAP